MKRQFFPSCMALSALFLPFGQAQAGALTTNMRVACQIATPYRQAPGVEYQPGVDIAGKPVAPADLSPPLDLEVDRIIVPVKIDLTQRLGQADQIGLEEKALLGVVALSDGQVLFNGQPISSGAMVLLNGDCVKAGDLKKVESATQ